MSDTEFIYNAVPYPSYVFPQTHPDRLATLGRLHGIETASPGSCRVLELGCGDGTNLLAMAYALKGSEFVGIDLSEPHIEDANSAAAQLKIDNAKFYQMDVTAADPSELGKFDFIIAHGLFSWVPDMVRASILELYRQCLTANGIGYISYNALPGCRIRQITNDLMQFHTRGEADAVRKVESGIEILEFVAESAEFDSIYQATLMLELEQIKERSVGNVFHDDLSDFNRPFLFHEFCSLADEYGLQYLCESEPSNILDKGLSAETIAELDRISPDHISREQYRDFITGRRFRSTLICSNDVSPERRFDPNVVDSFLVASQIVTDADAAAICGDAPVKFVTPKGNNLTVNHPLTKAALVTLGGIWCRSLSVEALIQAVNARFPEIDTSPAAADTLRSYLLQMYLAGFVRFHVFETNFVSTLSQKPIASAFARWQLEHDGRSVTTLTGTNLEPEFDSVRVMLSLLDGEHTREDVIREVKKMLSAAESSREFDDAEIAEMVDANLATIASAGLLIG